MTGACFGAGLDIISAADIRYCTEDAYFCVKEVDLAITADMGVLQRLPGLIGQGDCAPFLTLPWESTEYAVLLKSWVPWR